LRQKFLLINIMLVVDMSLWIHHHSLDTFAKYEYGLLKINLSRKDKAKKPTAKQIAVK